MEQYIVTGMSCAACQTRVEKAVAAVPGVETCTVSLLTNTLGVEGTAAPAEIMAAVERAGYGIAGKDKQGEEEALKDRETPVLRKRLIASAIVLAVLMYLTMGVSMAGFPLPAFLQHNHLVLTILQCILAAAVMGINHKFFTRGFGSLFRLSPNMDTLVALGSSVSFLWSLSVLVRIALMTSRGAALEEVHAIYHGELYFESAAMIPTLITVGKLLEAISKGKTTDAIKSLLRLTPQTAVVLRDGKEQTVPVEEIVKGDSFVLTPGSRVPVDGKVTEGEGACDEAMLTGESDLIEKHEGDRVSAATTALSGRLICEATHVGEDTTFAQIVRMVSDAAATKAPIARVADRVSAVFVPTVMGIALVTFVGWMIGGATLSEALARGICVLVISCPCALGLATPVAIMVGNGMGARHGILFKTSEAVEQLGRVKTIVFDKTGTLTMGQPEVLKPGAVEAVANLKKSGLKVVLLSGDKKEKAEAIGAQLGVDQVISEVLPGGKGDVILKLQQEGKVAMVGDGVNDAPALTQADVGLAIGNGTDVAVDSADVVLTKGSPADVAAAHRLSRKTLTVIYENLFWAFFYNLICIPLAAGLFGWKMNPMFGAAAMSLSSVTVCLNALRLNLYHIYGRRKKMKQTIKVEGMMCGHCEATVKKALEALSFVENAEVSKDSKTAVLTLAGDLDEAAVKAAVEAKDFTYGGLA